MEQISTSKTIIENPGMSNSTSFLKENEGIKNKKNIKINKPENPFKKEASSVDKKLILKMVQKIAQYKIKKEKAIDEVKKNETFQGTFQKLQNLKIDDKKITQEKEINNQKGGYYSSSKNFNESIKIGNFGLQPKDKTDSNKESISNTFSDIVKIKDSDSTEKNEDSKKERNKSKIISKDIKNLNTEKIDVGLENNNEIKNKEKNGGVVGLEENIEKYYNQNRKIISKTDNFIEALQNLSDNITLNNAIILAKIDTIPTSLSNVLSSSFFNTLSTSLSNTLSSSISNSISSSISNAIPLVSEKLTEAIKTGFASLKENK